MTQQELIKQELENERTRLAESIVDLVKMYQKANENAANVATSTPSIALRYRAKANMYSKMAVTMSKIMQELCNESRNNTGSAPSVT